MYIHYLLHGRKHTVMGTVIKNYSAINDHDNTIDIIQISIKKRKIKEHFKLQMQFKRFVVINFLLSRSGFLVT